MKKWFFIVLCLVNFSCVKHSNLEQTLEFAGSNSIELEKVLKHYEQNDDERKLKAAKFLISNMGYNKFGYEGDI